MQKFSTPNHGSSQDRLASARPCPTYCSLAMVHQATVTPSPWSASPHWLTPTAIHTNTETPCGPSQNQHMHRSSCGAGNVNSSLPKTFSQVQRKREVFFFFCCCSFLSLVQFHFFLTHTVAEFKVIVCAIVIRVQYPNLRKLKISACEISSGPKKPYKPTWS